MKMIGVLSRNLSSLYPDTMDQMPTSVPAFGPWYTEDR